MECVRGRVACERELVAWSRTPSKPISRIMQLLVDKVQVVAKPELKRFGSTGDSRFQPMQGVTMTNAAKRCAPQQ